MNETTPELVSNKKELEMMIRRILKEERVEKATAMTPEISTKNGNDQLIAEARKVFETTIREHAERNGLPKSPEEQKKFDEERKKKKKQNDSRTS